MSAVAAVMVAGGVIGLAPAANAAGYIQVQDGCTQFNAVVPVGVEVRMALPEGCDFQEFSDAGALTYVAEYDAVQRVVKVTLTNGEQGFVYALMSTESESFDGPNFIACGAYPEGEEPGDWEHIYYCDAPLITPSSSSPIPAWVQAYGRASADATCEDGWNPSWQSWAEPVTGGWVCTRSIPSLG